MLKVARATAVGVYGKECAPLMEDVVMDYLRRIEDSHGPRPADGIEPPSRLVADLEYAERAFAGFDERNATRAEVIYVPPPVGAQVPGA